MCSAEVILYHRSKVKVEAEEAAKGDANDVVAADIDIGDEGLPSAPNSYPCSKRFASMVSVRVTAETTMRDVDALVVIAYPRGPAGCRSLQPAAHVLPPYQNICYH
jgi:predicted alpha/beta-hydrolase family hydrolase